MIKVDEQFSIKPDTYSWTLIKTEKKTKEDGTEYESVDNWYYPKLSNCLAKYMDESLKPSETISELLLRLDGIEENLETIKNNLFKP